MKKVLLGIIVSLFIIVGFILNIKYFSEKKGIVKNDFLALDNSTALKNVTIKKELLEAKEYYTAGDNIKYKFSVTNNNSEAVTVNVLDNYSNLEKNQGNLVLTGAKCGGKEVSITGNEIKIKEQEIASHGTYTCTVEAYTKKTFPEGNVNSRVKVYIDNQDIYNESDFTYVVRDSFLDIQVNQLGRYHYYWQEPVEYEIKIKNLNQDKASDKVEFVFKPSKALRFKEPYNDNIEYSTSGSTKNLVDNHNIKVTCKAPDGEVCVNDLEQIINSEISGINPNETISFKVKFYYSLEHTAAIPLNTKIIEYEKNQIKKEINKGYSVTISDLTFRDVLPSITLMDASNKIINDLNSLEFKNGKAALYLNYDFNRVDSAYNLNKNIYAVRLTTKLESNVEYLESQQPIFTSCSDTENKIEKDTNQLYNINLGCALAKNTNKANIKVPITVTKRLLNKLVCFDSFDVFDVRWATNVGNRYNIGPELELTNIEAGRKGEVLDISFSIRNSASTLSSSNAQDVKLTYNYEAGLEIDESSLTDAIINKTNKTITWTIPLIRKGETVTVTVKAKNAGNLSRIKASGTIEGEGYDETVAIGVSSQTYEKGDWNLNSEVNVSDVIYARKYVAQAENLPLPPAEVYDFNNDNDATIIDIIGLRQLIANK